MSAYVHVRPSGLVVMSSLGIGCVNSHSVTGTGAPDATLGHFYGLLGTCINGLPCRGFGILAGNGQPVCACYATPGGCRQDERCDAPRKTSVPESLPGWSRLPDD